MRRVIRPGSDHVSCSLFRMSRSVAIGDAQAAEMNKIILSVPLIDWRIFRTRVQPHLGKCLANFRQGGNVVFMCVGDEEMPQQELVLLREFQDRLGFPASIKQCGFSRNLVPKQVAIYGYSLRRRGNTPELAPEAEVFFCWFPVRNQSL